jgi:hypothetical protein
MPDIVDVPASKPIRPSCKISSILVDAASLAKLSRRENRVRGKSDFVRRFNRVWVVQPLRGKYVASVFQKYMI